MNAAGDVSVLPWKSSEKLNRLADVHKVVISYSLNQPSRYGSSNNDSRYHNSITSVRRLRTYTDFILVLLAPTNTLVPATGSIAEEYIKKNNVLLKT